MNILDTFYIRFLSNAKDVQKDTDAAGKSVDGFEKKINSTSQSAQRAKDPFTGFAKVVNESGEATRSLSAAFGDLLVTGLGAFSAFEGFKGLKDAVGDSINQNAELARTNILTGEAAEKIKAVDDAFANTTGKKGEFISWFSQYSAYLQSIGLDSQNVIPNLKEFSSELATLTDAQARIRFQQLSAATGLPQDFFIQLRQGGAALDALEKKMAAQNETTEQGTKDALAYASAWDNVKTSIGGVFTNIGNWLSGPLGKFFTFLNDAVLPDWSNATKKSGVLPFLPGYETGSQLRALIKGGAGKSGSNISLSSDGISIDGSAPPDGTDGLLSNSAAAATLARAAKGDAALTADPAKQQQMLDLLAQSQRHISTADATGINSAVNSGGTSNQNSKSLTIGSIVIQTPQGASPQDVAKVVTDQLNQQFRTTIGNADDSVAR